VARPWCYALALNGENGVVEVLRNLLADVDITLGLAGVTSVTELNRENLTLETP